jgi:hypothetical protein
VISLATTSPPAPGGTRLAIFYISTCVPTSDLNSAEPPEKHSLVQSNWSLNRGNHFHVYQELSARCPCTKQQETQSESAGPRHAQRRTPSPKWKADISFEVILDRVKRPWALGGLDCISQKPNVVVVVDAEGKVLEDFDIEHSAL